MRVAVAIRLGGAGIEIAHRNRVGADNWPGPSSSYLEGPGAQDARIGAINPAATHVAGRYRGGVCSGAALLMTLWAPCGGTGPAHTPECGQRCGYEIRRGLLRRTPCARPLATSRNQTSPDGGTAPADFGMKVRGNLRGDSDGDPQGSRQTRPRPRVEERAQAQLTTERSGVAGPLHLIRGGAPHHFPATRSLITRTAPCLPCTPSTASPLASVLMPAPRRLAYT